MVVPGETREHRLLPRRGTTRMPRQPGLDGRNRDNDGQIRAKNGNTRIGTLRETYGDEFAAGFRSDMKLDTLLDESGAPSLTQFLKRSD